MNKKNKAYEFWSSINSPKTSLAPMLDCNDLPFRLLCRKYNTQLTYTQMYSSTEIIINSSYQNQIIKNLSPELDFPCFIQIYGNDPEILLKSAKILQKYTPCIDINLGCPQSNAKKNNYGAFLLEKEDEVYKIIGYLTNNNINISCKIRLFENLEKTYNLCRKLCDLGIKVICVHGRTKEQIKKKKGLCNLNAIKNIKKMINIPVIANGSLGNFEDIDKCFNETDCDCVMSGEKLLEMPFFFSKKIYDIDDIVLDYLNIYEKNYNYLFDSNIIQGHLTKFYYPLLINNIEMNKKLGYCNNIKDYINLANEIKNLRKNMNLNSKFGWYNRHEDNHIIKCKINRLANKGEKIKIDAEENVGDLFD